MKESAVKFHKKAKKNSKIWKHGGKTHWNYETNKYKTLKVEKMSVNTFNIEKIEKSAIEFEKKTNRNR